MPNNKQARRKMHIDNVVANLRIESLHPSHRLTEQLSQFADGTITTGEMLEDVKRRYVPLPQLR